MADNRALICNRHWGILSYAVHYPYLTRDRSFNTRYESSQYDLRVWKGRTWALAKMSVPQRRLDGGMNELAFQFDEYRQTE